MAKWWGPMHVCSVAYEYWWSVKNTRHTWHFLTFIIFHEIVLHIDETAWRRAFDRFGLWEIFESNISVDAQKNWNAYAGPVMPYGGTNLGQYWLRQWLVAWRHQVLTQINVDFSSVRFCGNHLRAITQWVPELLFFILRLTFIILKHCHFSQGPRKNQSLPIAPFCM